MTILKLNPPKTNLHFSPPPPGQPLISVRNLEQTLSHHTILQGINLDILRGETLVLLGKSGCGKSVFLRHLIGLLKPKKGNIIFEGVDISNLSETQLAPVRKRIGIVFQDGALFDSLNVFDNVAFPLREREAINCPFKIQERVAEVLELVNMTGHEKKLPASLSGGMRKRVALARAIACPPDVLLYDEPTAGLDPIISDSINRLIRRLQERLGITSVVVTHDLASTRFIADRVALLHEGRIHFLGSVEDLFSSNDPIVYNFVNAKSTETDL
ncbi:MAG: ABC transporter ATP-binding protein [Chthoniobacterales bacterium]|nr:ABC transporter ATP-binding protein [Chthoniobacterales bacterium]